MVPAFIWSSLLKSFVLTVVKWHKFCKVHYHPFHRNTAVWPCATVLHQAVGSQPECSVFAWRSLLSMRSRPGDRSAGAWNLKGTSCTAASECRFGINESACAFKGRSPKTSVLRLRAKPACRKKEESLAWPSITCPWWWLDEDSGDASRSHWSREDCWEIGLAVCRPG